MNDYKELIGELKEECPDRDYGYCELAFRAADIIEQLVKERDAEPVIHGHWINRRNSVYCSRCGKGYRNGVGTISALNHNYCPNCGAKMDEEDNT